MRNDWRIFGIAVNLFVVALCAFTLAATLILFFVLVAWIWQAFSPYSESQVERSCPHSDIPAEVRTPGMKCVISSPQDFSGNTSWLRDGYRHDSKLIIQHMRSDEKRGIVEGCGCGRCFTKADSAGHLLSPQSRETYCNLGGHITGEERRPHTGRYRWANTWNQHPG